ncbi:ATP-binding cassette domain-containing protein, partial [bacterium]|nr:ATP-binding cassette domain-containing protein [bacterium]
LIFDLNCVTLRARDNNLRFLSELKIAKGEKVAIVGSDVEYRKSLMRVLSGLEAPKSGQIQVDGENVPCREDRDPWRDIFSKNFRRKIGISLQSDALISNVSIGECFETLFRFKYGDHNDGLKQGAIRVPREVAASLGMPLECLDKRPAELNPLEKRLASLCLAFLTKPSILMMDNPSYSLDDEAWSYLDAAIAKLIQGTQKTLILSTADWILADSLCDRWVVLEDGKMVFDGHKAGYRKNFRSHFVQQLETERWKKIKKTIKDLEIDVA